MATNTKTEGKEKKVVFDIVKKRLLKFCDYKGFKRCAFYKIIAVPQSNCSGKGAVSSLSCNKLIQILTTLPEINPDWLLLGKGAMLRNSEPEEENGI
jgi:hypothetical protein